MIITKFTQKNEWGKNYQAEQIVDYLEIAVE